MKRREVKEAGWISFWDGLGEEENPYPHQTDNWLLWSKGWNDGYVMSVYEKECETELI